MEAEKVKSTTDEEASRKAKKFHREHPALAIEQVDDFDLTSSFKEKQKHFISSSISTIFAYYFNEILRYNVVFVL